MQTGYFGRTPYDKSVYDEDVFQSTSPYGYVMNSDRIHNVRGCLNQFGPVSGLMGAGVSSPTGDVIAASQMNVDIDSVMSNRNVPLSKAKNGKVNPVDLNKIKTQNVPLCVPGVDQAHSRMTDPAMFYRGAPINRMHDLLRDPQANIFYDFAVNTRLEAKDNFIPLLETPTANWRCSLESVPVCNIDYKQKTKCGQEYCMSCSRDEVYSRGKPVAFFQQ